MTCSSIDLDRNIILILSELLRAEYSDEDASRDVDSHHGDDLDNDNEEAEPNSRVLAHVELGRTIREFGPSGAQEFNSESHARKESPRCKSRTSNQSTFPSGTYSTILI